MSSEFDIPPGLVASLDRPAPASPLARVLGWIDKLIPLPPSPWLQVIAVMVAGATLGLLKVTASMSKAWSHYTRGSLSSGALTGHLLIGAPALMGLAVSAYLLRRAFGAKLAAPPPTRVF